VLARLFAPPFNAGLQSSRRIGLTKLVHWLEEQPGDTWQDRRVSRPGVIPVSVGLEKAASRSGITTA